MKFSWPFLFAQKRGKYMYVYSHYRKLMYEEINKLPYI